MNNTFVKISASAALAVGFMIQTMLPASAGEIQNRLNTQQHRIHAAERSGQISHREARRDKRRLAHIRYEHNRDLRRNGGHLTRGEYAHQNAQLNHNSRDIEIQRH